MSLDRRRFLRAAALGAASTTALRGLGQAGAEKRRPNLVFFLADDLGWSDLSCCGSTYHQTPNIDALFARGLRFTQAYTANPLCSPTRASIQTGLYPGRIGITTPACHLPEEILEQELQEKAPATRKVLIANSLTRLKQEYTTLAERLKAAGYATGHFGKWHLGREPYDPLHQGFDVDFPHYPGPGPAGSYLGPWKFPEGLPTGEPGEHIEDRVSGEVVKFIRSNAAAPFYVNYWCFSVHSPWDAKPGLVEHYRALRDPDAGQRNPVYAAMLHSLDEGVGRVMRAIDEAGLAQDTIFVFFSDNGGVDWWEPGMQERWGMDDPPTSNAPLRGGKATLYEGGTRVPCAVVWPGVTPPGARTEALISSVDFHPTLLPLLGLDPPAGRSFDGVSFLPVLRGGKATRDTVFCHFPHDCHDQTGPGTWVRRGDWKLIRRYAANDDQTDA
ncbi:MAG: sulfatase, partial [Armatimonadetes bacterium]|nr:sulfatase [Armatimonadota bacterium]